MARFASIHIATFPMKRVVSVMAATPADKWAMNEIPECAFARVMGTSKQGTTKTSVQWNRWVVLSAWDDEDAFTDFNVNGEVLNRWRQSALSLENYVLDPIQSRGAWNGDALFPEATAVPADDDRIAVLTRAKVNWTKWWQFNKAIKPVDALLQQQPGCSLAFGMGEKPVGEQSTFSVWDSPASVEAFSYNPGAHKDVIRRTYQENWYAEELFARFVVRR